MIYDHPPDGPGHFLGHRLWQAPQVDYIARIPGWVRRSQGEAGGPFRGHVVVAVSGQTEWLGNLGPHGGEDLGIEVRLDLLLAVGAGFHLFLSGRSGARPASPAVQRPQFGVFIHMGVDRQRGLHVGVAQPAGHDHGVDSRKQEGCGVGVAEPMRRPTGRDRARQQAVQPGDLA